jgi:flagellar motor switch protein FliN/FliY
MATSSEKKPETASAVPPAAASGPDGRDEPSATAAAANMEFILDIPLEVTVELGRTKMLIHELLKLGQGSVIELSKLAGEPLEVLANQKLIARGEVVVVNEKFGVRLTEVVSPMERIERLR